jgi:hypothetical protein
MFLIDAVLGAQVLLFLIGDEIWCRDTASRWLCRCWWVEVRFFDWVNYSKR